jgi:DNA-binding beta-propeller fold protein YncE
MQPMSPRPFRPTTAVRIVALAVCMSAMAGCADAPRRAQNVPSASDVLVWPKPPAQARVRFVRNVASPADWGIARGALERLADAFTGQAPFRFVRPTGVAARANVLYVADPGAQAVFVFDAARGRQATVLRAGNEKLISPVAVALGPGDKVFIADSALGKVFALDREGKLQHAIGGEGRLARPAGIAYDAAADRLYVADSSTHRIIVFTGDGRMLGTFGTNGSAAGEFNFPTHLALTRDGEVVVTDTLNFRVQILARDGHPIASFGHVGDGSGDFASPKGVATDSSGVVYVVDSLFDTVQVFARDGTLLLAFGERGTRPGRFWLPNGIYIDPDDHIYVADAYNQRIAVFERVAAPASNPSH